MALIEKHTPRGTDLADAEGYNAVGPDKAELISRTDAIFERFQRAFSYFPNLSSISLSDSEDKVWSIDGRWNEEEDKLDRLSFMLKNSIYITLDRNPSSVYPFVDYMSYLESLSERNSELVLSKTEKIADDLLKPFEGKVKDSATNGSS